MKSIKIKLNNSNPVKLNKLLDILTVLSDISKEYLPLRQKELETKEFKPFKEHYAYFRAKHPNINSGILQSHLRQQDSMIKSFISWCKKKHKIVSFPEEPKVSIPLRNDMFHFNLNKDSSFEDNRQTQYDFMCGNCNHKANADINASKNIFNLTVENDLNVNLGMSKDLNSEARTALAV